MSSHYVGYVFITVSDAVFTTEDKIFIDKQIGLMVEKSIINEATVNEGDDNYYFEISGDNGLDTSYLDTIKDQIAEHYEKLEIQVSEYVETGDGYFFTNNKEDMEE